MEEGARPKVDELEALGCSVNKHVLILDVAVDDAGGVKVHRCPDDLPEEVPRLRLSERSALGDVVEEVLDRVGALEDEDVTVRLLKVIEQLDTAVDVADLLQQVDLNRKCRSVNLQI